MDKNTMRTINTIIAACLIGCSQSPKDTPKTGDWYQRIKDDKKIQLFHVGTAKECLKDYDWWKNIFKESRKNWDKIEPLFVGDSTGIYVCYLENKLTRSEYCVFMPVSFLKQDYIKLSQD
jgi:hypothetical protein